ncbi:MAG TPA: hypothetical protein VFJ28_09535 [Marmoricola sp.]|nr:hypothetical protein [Marmoricola sp.]
MSAVDRDLPVRIAELRAAIEQARAMPMSASAVINRGEVLDLVNAVSAAADKAFSEAADVVEDRQAVVDAGHAEAAEILRQAQAERDRLVSDSHVYQVAQTKAAEILEGAEREAAELRAETDRYVEDKLANFELVLDRTLDVVRRGRTRINEGLVHGLGGGEDDSDESLPEHLG